MAQILYIVSGVEWHVGSTPLGVYDSYEKAQERTVTVANEALKRGYDLYDTIEIKKIIVNQSIE